jgi:Fucose-binding lectin II (PA-IIL)
VADVIKYGEQLVFRNATDNFSGWFMARFGKGTPDPCWTEIAPSAKNFPSDYVWTIEPAAGSSKRTGDPVCYTDHVHLKMRDNAGLMRYLSVHASNPDYAIALESTSAELMTWDVIAVSGVTPDGHFAGPYVNQIRYGSGNVIAFHNAKVDRILCSRNPPNEDPHGRPLPGTDPHALRLLPSNERELTSWWNANKSVTDTGDDTDGAPTDGSCILPPGTHFTVSGIGNSSEMHTVVIDIEGMPEDQAHPGFHVGPVGVFGSVNMVWPKTGSSGKVTVSVGVTDPDNPSKIDNPLKLLGRHVVTPNGTNLFIVSANDGAETGRDDCLITVTWPIEKQQ